uniref:Uncharacterized protein n=1 Tax=Ignisphaera aggregans TaxID=334771 RepID=A0A7J3Z5A4_9CREN
MSRESERELRGDTEGSKEILCEPIVKDCVARIYIVVDRGEYFIVFDPCYESGNVYVYKQVKSIGIDELRKEFREHRDRQTLGYLLIKKEFRKEPDLIYELCRCETR